MKIKISLFILFTILLQNCQQRSASLKSLDEAGRELLTKTEQTEDAPQRFDPAQGQEKSLYKVYTWQVETQANQNRLVIYGENLQEVSGLQIGEETLAVSSSADGTKAYSNYPENPVEGAQISLSIGNTVLVLPEPFSLLKPDGITRVTNCRFFRSEEGIPESIRQRLNVIIQFECRCGDFELTNAPITLLIGETTVPNNQIQEEGNLIKGYLEQNESLREGVPVMIDFGKGLRSLAGTTFSLE